MKRICLILFCVAFLPLPYTFCQESSTAKDKISPVFFDAGIGYTPYFGGMLDIGAGYRFNEQVAVGIGALLFQESSDCCQTYASGAGLQLRWTPSRRFIFKLEGGSVLNAKYGDDGSYHSVYDRSASQKFYFRTSAGVRIFRICNLGLTYAQTGVQYNEVRAYDTNQLLDPVPFTVNSLFIHLGIALPGK